LDYVDKKGVKAGGKYNLLPIAAIPVLDPQLAHPLRLQLQRPQLKSHPYLQGLHLLLRSSGLGKVEGQGDKARLVIDPATLESWNALNPTEQYFSLLEAWLLVSRSDMIGEVGRWDVSLLNEWAFSLRMAAEIPKEMGMLPNILFRVRREPYQAALGDL